MLPCKEGEEVDCCHVKRGRRWIVLPFTKHAVGRGGGVAKAIFGGGRW